MSRQIRVETRSRHQNDLKRVMHSTEKVRKWEKKWVRIEETSLQIFKWMPITKNEEQQRQLLQQQISAPAATTTDTQHNNNNSMGQKSSTLSYAQVEDPKRNQENILQKQRTATSQELSQTSNNARNTSMTLDSGTSAIGTTAGSQHQGVSAAAPKMNGQSGGDQHHPNTHNMNQASHQAGATPGSVSQTTNTLHGSLSNSKRPHEGGSDEAANESINSPNSKRIKTATTTTANILTTSGVTELVDENKMSTTLAPMQSAELLAPTLVPSPIPATQQQPHRGFTSDSNGTGLHIEQQQQQQQPSVQPSLTVNSTTTAQSTCPTVGVVAKLTTTPNGGGDIEMAMETDDGLQQPQQCPPTSEVSSVTDALMEDFSSIVRNVTEQIVLKVSDSHG